MFGQRKARLHNEEVKVVNESRTAVREARQYLKDLGKVMVHGQDLADIIDSVMARQAASLLLHRIELLVIQMNEHGILDAKHTERILHQCEHDGAKMHKRPNTKVKTRDSRRGSGHVLQEPGVRRSKVRILASLLTLPRMPCARSLLECQRAKRRSGSFPGGLSWERFLPLLPSSPVSLPLPTLPLLPSAPSPSSTTVTQPLHNRYIAVT